MRNTQITAIFLQYGGDMFSYEKLPCALQDGVIWWRIFTSALVKFRTKYRLSDASGPVSILCSDLAVWRIVKNNPPFWVANIFYSTDYYTQLWSIITLQSSQTKATAVVSDTVLLWRHQLLLICQWRKSTSTCSEPSLKKTNVGPWHKVLQYQNEYPLYCLVPHRFSWE
jgi:hypothetical protein